ncbi:hypothetical protein NKH73_11895 [Mesorhizobium sp. M0938]|uniref:hypothetical protein n=1 Tax=unclassified Mesorhizobium TaxID=325217 RepID=UPI003336CE53
MFELRFGSTPEPPPTPPADPIIDYLTIGANVIGSIAWPVAIVVVLLVFRKQLVRLVGRVKAVSGPAGIAATFSEQLEEAKEIAQDVPSFAQAALAEETKNDPFLELAQKFPEAAILNAYQELEKLFVDSKTGRRLPIPPGYMFRGLEVENVNGEDVADLFVKIRSTRNAAVHSRRPITVGEALEFRKLVQTLIAVITPFLPQLEAWQRERDESRPRYIYDTIKVNRDRS